MESGSAKKAMKRELESIREALEKVSTPEGRYMTPMLVDQTSYLYYMLGQADQRPGQDAYQRYEVLLQQYDGLQSDNDEYVGSW